MLTGPLDEMPLWLLFLIEVVVLMLAVEIGYRSGRWRRVRCSDEKDQPVGAMVGSILGLVALVLGFTFSLAASRFDARRQAVLEEANAIGTAYLRAELLPEPQRSKLTSLFREYVSMRIEGVQQGQLEVVLSRSEELHQQLWQQAVEVADAAPNSIVTGVFLQALNNVIDVHAKRVMVGIRSRIPWIIWFGLYGLAILGMAAVGYQAGLSVTRRSPAMPCLVLAFALVLSLISDLDRGREGLLQVSQQALIDLQQSMQLPSPTHAP